MRLYIIQFCYLPTNLTHHQAFNVFSMGYPFTRKMHGNQKTRKRERLIKLELGKMHAGIRHSKNECLRTDAYRYPSVKVINAQAVLAHIKEGASIAVILGE